MSKRYSVTMHHVITLYNNMFDYMHGMMRTLAQHNSQWNEDLFFAVKLARQKLSKYYLEVTPKTYMVRIYPQILNPFLKLRSCTMWDKGMDINPEDETSYSTQYPEAILKYVQNEYCAKHQGAPFNKLETVLNSNLVPYALASGSNLSSFDSYDVSSDDDEYLTSDNVPKITPGRSHHTARLMNASRLYFNSPPEAPKNLEQNNPNLINYDSDPTESSSTFCIPNITDWWRQKEDLHSKYTDLSNVARDIFSIIPHAVGVVASSSHGQDGL
jgi:hypothetical protein